MSFLRYFRDRRVLVTGLTGFKGLWLGLWLQRLGARVSGLALPPDPAMRAGWPGIEQRFCCADADVRDLDAVGRVVGTVEPEVVFHLAAQPLVRLGYRQPVETFAANVLGTVHVLEAARAAASVRAVVVISSDKCYLNREQSAGYTEDDALGGHDPYSASKACAEIVTASYRRSYGRPSWLVGSARAGNVIGGGDWSADRLVPDLCRSALAGQPLRLRHPQAVRPWQHVLEPLSGYLTLAALLGQGRADLADGWNFGPRADDAVCVERLARLLAGRWGGIEVEVAHDPAGPPETGLLRLDSTRAERRLAWRPLLSLPERVEWTVDWYRCWQSNPAGVWRCAEQQLHCYEERLAAAPERTAA
jgi:CDP-glucose 4,6-dehydratase